VTFTVQSAESLFTPEEQAAHKAYLAAQGARYADRINDAATQERDRIAQNYGATAAKTFERYALAMHTADRFVAKKDDGGEWQIPNLIPRTGSGLHVGVSGSLKSFGEIWIADEVNQRGGYSLIVLGEGARGFKRRLRAYADYYGRDLKDMPAVMECPISLFDRDSVVAFIAAVKILHPLVSYIVFDTKWRNSGAANEDSATDTAVVFGNVDLIGRTFNAFSMLVAHLGKDTSRGVRGSSSQYAAVDMELTQQRSGDYCTIATTKVKDGPDDNVHTFKVVGVDLGGGESSLVLEPVEAADAAVSIKPPKGPTERAVWDHAQTLGERFTEEALVSGVIDTLRKTNAKVRATTVRRSVKAMIGEYFIQHGEEYALRAPLIRDNADWL
jgi:hypothetical protein